MDQYDIFSFYMEIKFKKMVLPGQFKSHFIFQMHLRNEFDFWKVH